MHLFLISFSRVNSDAPPLPHSRGIKVCSFEFLIRTFFWSSNNPGCWGTGKNFREEETFLGEGSDGTSDRNKIDVGRAGFWTRVQFEHLSLNNVSIRSRSSEIISYVGLGTNFYAPRLSLSLSHLGLNGDRRTRFSPSETRKREDRGVWRISNCG